MKKANLFFDLIFIGREKNIDVKILFIHYFYLFIYYYFNFFGSGINKSVLLIIQKGSDTFL